MIKIVQRDAPVLRKTALKVPLSEIGGKKITKHISDLKAALEQEEDGVAIAAPQLDIPLQIFIVSHKVFDIMRNEKEENEEAITKEYNDLVFINPVIEKLSREKAWVEEGCLSVRWLYGKVARSKKAKIKAYNEQGTEFSMGASGLLAQIFQHETDHLNGILFIDKAKQLEEIPPEHIKATPRKKKVK